MDTSVSDSLRFKFPVKKEPVRVHELINRSLQEVYKGTMPSDRPKQCQR